MDTSGMDTPGHDATPTGRPSDDGASSVEYALLIGLIALVIIVAVTLLGTNLLDLFSTAATSF